MNREEVTARIGRYGGWRHRIEVAPGIFTPGPRNPASKLALLGLPAEMKGLHVLDIGTADGWFAFECERRGAERVVGMDVREPTGFAIAADLLGSRVEYIQGSFLDVNPGQFDLVLCLDVLYHLPEPYTALRRLRTLCRDSLVLSTISSDQYGDATDTPTLRFLRRWDRYPDPSVFFAISRKGLVEMLEDVGFRVERAELNDTDRIFVNANVR